VEYVSLQDAIRAPGLRLVTLRGLPSPWSQAAKTFFELKQIPFVIAPQLPGEPNEDLVEWSGQASAPVVAWQDEPPRHHWLDILFLAERLAPEPVLLPADAGARAQLIGLSHELCGELGIGWCRRLMMFKPAFEEGNPPEPIARMAARYRYDAAQAEAAPTRIADVLRLFSDQLRSQRGRGSRFFVGDAMTAVDIYWAAFANLIDPLPDALCPIPADWRPAFVNHDPTVADALDKSLLEHRDWICEEYFRLPMEF